MSKVAICPTCGSKSKIKEIGKETTYLTLQDDELIKKVAQLKRAMEKYKDKAENLQEQLDKLELKNKE